MRTTFVFHTWQPWKHKLFDSTNQNHTIVSQRDKPQPQTHKQTQKRERVRRERERKNGSYDFIFASTNSLLHLSFLQLPRFPFFQFLHPPPLQILRHPGSQVLYQSCELGDDRTGDTIEEPDPIRIRCGKPNHVATEARTIGTNRRGTNHRPLQYLSGLQTDCFVAAEIQHYQPHRRPWYH